MNIIFYLYGFFHSQPPVAGATPCHFAQPRQRPRYHAGARAHARGLRPRAPQLCHMAGTGGAAGRATSGGHRAQAPPAWPGAGAVDWPARAQLGAECQRHGALGAAGGICVCAGRKTRSGAMGYGRGAAQRCCAPGCGRFAQPPGPDPGAPPAPGGRGGGHRPLGAAVMPR